MPLSAKNPRLAAARKLARDAKERAERGLFLVEGPKLVREALAARVKIREAFATEDSALVKDLVRAGVAVHEVEPKTLAEISSVETAQGIVAVAEAPTEGGEEALIAGDGDLLLAAGVQDPGNAGALVRIAEAAGFAAVVADRASADFFSPKAVRGSAGSVLRVPAIRVADLGAFAEALAARGVAVLAANPRGGVDPRTAKLPKRVALLVGSEGRGIPDRLAKACTGAVTIPMARGVESLNVATAAAVLAFDLARRAR